MLLIILRNFLLYVSICFYLCDTSSAIDRILVLERPVIEYVNSSFGRVVNITSTRLGRHDPLYYVNMYYESYVTATKYYVAHISVDEHLSYSSKRRYIDMEWSLCKFLSVILKTNIIFYKKNNEDEFSGLQIKSDCELAVGFYHLPNMTWRAPAIPFQVHFSEGRVNVKIFSKEKAVVGYGHIDLAMRSLPKRKG